MCEPANGGGASPLVTAGVAGSELTLLWGFDPFDCRDCTVAILLGVVRISRECSNAVDGGGTRTSPVAPSPRLVTLDTAAPIKLSASGDGGRGSGLMPAGSCDEMAAPVHDG